MVIRYVRATGNFSKLETRRGNGKKPVGRARFNINGPEIEPDSSSVIQISTLSAIITAGMFANFVWPREEASSSACVCARHTMQARRWTYKQYNKNHTTEQQYSSSSAVVLIVLILVQLDIVV